MTASANNQNETPRRRGDAGLHSRPHRRPRRRSRYWCSASRYLRVRAPPTARSPCPQGAHAGQLILHACQLRHGERQLRRRLRHARRAREPRRPALAADRAAGRPHPRPVGAPGRADLPPRGRPRHHEHEVPRREPVRRQPRRRPRRLPRRRRLRPARLPGGRVGAASTRPTSSARSPCRAYGDGVPGLRGRGCEADGVDLAGYAPAAAGRRPRGRPRRARLRPHRPPQRERRDAHGDDLLLALPAAASTAR